MEPWLHIAQQRFESFPVIASAVTQNRPTMVT
jgi:hypothetical protein